MSIPEISATVTADISFLVCRYCYYLLYNDVDQGTPFSTMLVDTQEKNQGESYWLHILFIRLSESHLTWQCLKEEEDSCFENSVLLDSKLAARLKLEGFLSVCLDGSSQHNSIVTAQFK